LKYNKKYLLLPLCLIVVPILHSLESDRSKNLIKKGVKSMKKIYSLVVAMMMVVAFGTVTFAADAPATPGAGAPATSGAGAPAAEPAKEAPKAEKKEKKKAKKKKAKKEEKKEEAK
jgi:hypothetical protein